MKAFLDMSPAAQKQFEQVRWVVNCASRQQQIFQRAFTAQQKREWFTCEQRRGLTGPVEELNQMELKIDLTRVWQEATDHSLPRTHL